MENFSLLSYSWENRTINKQKIGNGQKEEELGKLDNFREDNLKRNSEFMTVTFEMRK